MQNFADYLYLAIGDLAAKPPVHFRRAPVARRERTKRRRASIQEILEVYVAPMQREITQGAYESAISQYMRQVYGWMSAGLAITAVMAYAVAGTPAVSNVVLGNSIVLILLIVAQFGLVIALSAAIHKMSPMTATALFILYSALTGVTMSSIFLYYPIGKIGTAFLVASGMFLAMTVYGTVTKRDLSGMGTFLFMGLIGIIIAAIVNMFLKNGMMTFIISCVGVVVFTGMTAYDTQKLREFGSRAPLDDPGAVRRGAILGALTLYLDFINLFLMLLRLFGNGRD